MLQTKQIHHVCSWRSHCTGPLWFSIILWEKGCRETWISVKQLDIKSDRWEKELISRLTLTSVNAVSWEPQHLLATSSCWRRRSLWYFSKPMGTGKIHWIYLCHLKYRGRGHLEGNKLAAQVAPCWNTTKNLESTSQMASLYFSLGSDIDILLRTKGKEYSNLIRKVNTLMLC